MVPTTTDAPGELFARLLNRTCQHFLLGSPIGCFNLLGTTTLAVLSYGGRRRLKPTLWLVLTTLGTRNKTPGMALKVPVS